MNYKKQYLLERLKTKLQFAYDNYGKENILGIFLYGSQNYNCETETSDVDAKVIYVPCLMEAIINKSRLVKTHIFENGEHLEIIDIRELVENYKKQNINFIETLFTEYYILNPIYAQVFEAYFTKDFRKNIARYDEYKCLQSYCGQAIHTLSQAMNLDDKSNKKYANSLRIKNFLERFIFNKEDFKNCLVPSNLDEVMKYKTNQEKVNVGQILELKHYFEKQQKLPKEQFSYNGFTALNLDNAAYKIIKFREKW